MKTVRVYPSTNIIDSWINASGVDLGSTIKELIDNCFDAGAKLVRVTIAEEPDGTNRIVVWDNGVGNGNFLAFFKAGEHQQLLAQPGLGKYGIGLTESSAWLGEHLEVRSFDGTANVWAGANGPAQSQ